MLDIILGSLGLTTAGTFAGLVIYGYFLRYSYWKKRGIEQYKWQIPMHGDMKSVLTYKTTLPIFCTEQYKRHRGLDMFGLYYGTIPVLLVRDPGLIRNILAQDKDAYDPAFIPDEELDPLLSVCPPLGDGGEMVQRLFTPERLQYSYEKLLRLQNNFATEIAIAERADFSNIINKFAVDIMMELGFGFSPDHSKDDPDYNNALYVADSIKYIFETPGRNNERLVSLYYPSYALRKKYRFVPEEVHNRLRQVVVDLLGKRPWSPLIHRQCMLRWMTTNVIIEEDEMLQCLFMFFVEVHIYLNVIGNFAIAHLARIEEYQERARREANEIVRDNDGCIPIRALDNLTYMDLVLKETLRLHPPLGCIGKVCIKKEVMRGNDENRTFEMEAGGIILLPILGMHRDEKYWRNSNCFNPDRFTIEKLRSMKVPIPYVPYQGSTCPAFLMAALKTMLVIVLKHKIVLDLTAPLNPDENVHFTSARGVLVNLE